LVLTAGLDENQRRLPRRFLCDGRLDPAFSGDGVILRSPSSGIAQVALTSPAGRRRRRSSGVCRTRLGHGGLAAAAGGALDRTFGQGGKVLIDFTADDDGGASFDPEGKSSSAATPRVSTARRCSTWRWRA
jgi:hypothetical protein